MDVSSLFQQGKLREAIDAQLGVVKASPMAEGARLFLFELLSFAGEFARARRQIDVLSSSDPAIETGYALYRRLLEAEDLRRRVFEEGLQPEFFSPPPEHVRQRLEAVRLLHAGKADEAKLAIDAANASLPALAGHWNGTATADLRDGDDLLAGILEVMANGKYYWIPLADIVRLEPAPPRFPRDLIWAPAELETAESEGQVFLPVLYFGTWKKGDELCQLGRGTQWSESPAGPTLGIGAHTFLLDETDAGLRELKEWKRADGEA